MRFFRRWILSGVLILAAMTTASMAHASHVPELLSSLWARLLFSRIRAFDMERLPETLNLFAELRTALAQVKSNHDGGSPPAPVQPEKEER